MVYPLAKINQPAKTTGNGITTIVLDDEPAKPLAPGASVNLQFGKGSFHVPLEDKTGTWWFSCTDGSLVWNAADEPLIDNLGGAAVPGAIANGSKVAAIGDSTQKFRLDGVEKDGPLIYRTTALVTIQRPEGQTAFEVTVSGAGGTSSKGSGITAISLASTPSAPIEPGNSVNLHLAAGSFHAPLANKSGLWWFDCTDNSVVWNAADEPLITGIAGASVAGAIANGSKVAAIGDTNQQFRFNGVVSAGPLIYRSLGMVTIARPEGATVYEVTIDSSGSAAAQIATVAEMQAGTEVAARSVSPKLVADAVKAIGKIPVQSTPPSPSEKQVWFDNTGGGLVLNISDGSSWFAIG